MPRAWLVENLEKNLRKCCLIRLESCCFCKIPEQPPKSSEINMDTSGVVFYDIRKGVPLFIWMKHVAVSGVGM